MNKFCSSNCLGVCRFCQNDKSILGIEKDFMFDKPHEACGVVGVSVPDHGYQIAQLLYHGLMALQHRGQEAAGLAVTNGTRKIQSYKRKGLVNEILTPEILDQMWGNVGIGHNRYGTAGSSELKNAQPYVLKNNQSTFALAFNGNIANYEDLKKRLMKKGRIFTCSSDTEVIAKIIGSTSIGTEDWVENLKLMSRFLDGSYCILFLTCEGDIYAIRDPLGFKPLCYGILEEDENKVTIIASESCAIDAVEGNLIADVKPGEIVHLDQNREIHSEAIISSPIGRKALCQFEFVYFARPDSVIDGIPVEEVRVKLGKNLAKSQPVDSSSTVIVPVPDSGRSAALGYAMESGIPFREGLMKNRYVWRTFITPGQTNRLNLVRQKLNPVKSIIEGKEIVLIDDSIVRATTMGRIVSMVKSAGAKKVHVRISCPPVREPCYMGVDFPTKEELIAGKLEKQYPNQPDKVVEKICEFIGADSLGFQTIDGLVEAINGSCEELCLACLNGDYPLKQIPQASLEQTFSLNRA